MQATLGMLNDGTERARSHRVGLLRAAAAILVEVVWRWAHVRYATRAAAGRGIERWARRHGL
jgi:hypothetical protein